MMDDMGMEEDLMPYPAPDKQYLQPTPAHRHRLPFAMQVTKEFHHLQLLRQRMT